MGCQENTSRDASDQFEVGDIARPFDLAATGWLVGQGVRYLNSSDKEGELGYQHVVRLLAERRDAEQTLAGLSRRVAASDYPLRWSLLYLMGEVGTHSSVDFLIELAVEPVPEQLREGGCEGPRDGEILVRTMAVEGLQNIATRHQDVAKAMLKIIDRRPVRPVLIEAVKAAVALGLKDRVVEMLPKEDHWIIDIRRARIDEVRAEPERDDATKYGFAPPKEASLSTSPHRCCQCPEEK